MLPCVTWLIIYPRFRVECKSLTAMYSRIPASSNISLGLSDLPIIAFRRAIIVSSAVLRMARILTN